MDLITSIPPAPVREPSEVSNGARDYFDACRASWQHNGLTVRSLNRRSELATSGPWPDVLITEFDDEGDALFAGRFGPSLGAIFDAMPPRAVSALVNADVFMLSVPDMAQRLAVLCADGLVIARRVDIDDLGGAFRSFGRGVDFVAFAPEVLGTIVRDRDLRRFKLGVTWWDYVLPVAASFFVPVRRIRDPFILHRIHQKQWSRPQDDATARLALATLTNLARQAGPGNRWAQKFLGRLGDLATADSHTTEDISRRLGDACVQWLFDPSGSVAEVALPIDLSDGTFQEMFRATIKRAVAVSALAQLPNPSPLRAITAAAATDLRTTARWTVRSVGRALRQAKRRRFGERGSQ